MCSDNELGDESGTAILNALRHLPHLRDLYLQCALVSEQPNATAFAGSGSHLPRACALCLGLSPGLSLADVRDGACVGNGYDDCDDDRQR